MNTMTVHYVIRDRTWDVLISIAAKNVSATTTSLWYRPYMPQHGCYHYIVQQIQEDLR